MRLLLSSALLGLAWFSAANIALSAVAWLLARGMMRRERALSGSALLAIRLLPTTASVLFVTTVFLPAHWRFELAATEETFGIVLTLLAALGFGLLGQSAWRATCAGRAGHRFNALTRLSAKPLAEGAFEVGGGPGVSLVGILRPRIVVSSEARASLTPAELAVAISHEVAHRRSHDNLKRFAMSCAPDLFAWFPVARALEARWQAAAECQADDHAVMGDENRALVLASALVRVARLSSGPTVVRQSPVWSAFHVPTLLETRVRRLVVGPIAAPVARRRVWSACMIAALTVPVAVWLLGFSHTLHVVTETIVTLLP
jgi:Zn-dependent protease with chaperone function